MKPPMAVKEKRSGVSVVVLALLMASFLTLITFSPAHAASPTVNHTVTSASTQGNNNPATAILTVTNAGDVIAVAVFSTSSGNNNIESTSSITDTFGNSYSAVLSSGNVVDGVPPCNTTQCGNAEFWVSTSATTGADTVSVNISPATATTIFAFTAYDMTGVNPTPASTATGVCTTANAPVSSCLSGTVTGTTSTTFGVNTIQIAAASTTGAAFFFTAGSSAWTLAGGVNNVGASEYSTAGTFGQVSPTTFPFTKSAGGGVTYWTESGIVFGPSSGVTTVTTVINTLCTGACSGGPNGTSTVFSVAMPHEMVFYYSQNTASPGLIDNVSLKIASVHINTPTGTCFIATYTTSNPTTAPSGGNPWTLQNTQSITITNNTSNFYVHNNPQVNIGSSYFFAVGVMFNTNASRGSGAAGDGVKVYETSQTGINEYSFNPPSTTPPASFSSTTLKTPRDWIFIHLFSTIATSTSTSTLTISGTLSVTTTVTSTTLDEQIAINSMTNYAIALLLILGPGLLLGGAIGIWTRSFPGVAIGFIVGILIGTGLGVQAGLVTTGFEALAAIAVVFLGIMAFVGSRGGG